LGYHSGTVNVRTSLALLLALAVAGCSHTKRERANRKRPSRIENAPLTITFFDLGQADGMLIRYQGKTLLMDSGESRVEDDAQRVHHISKALEEAGNTRLDAFVVSHYHRDHVGDPKPRSGMWMLFDDGVTISTLYDRGEVIYGGGGKGETQREYEKALPGWLSSGKVKAHQSVKVGDLIPMGDGLTVEVVAVNGNGRLEALDQKDPSELQHFPASENDYSVALKVTYGDFELFAGGDLTGSTKHRDFKGHREGYHDIESSTAARVGDVEIYRADHHGSQHSSNPCFLKVLRPEVAIISSGENNYGHPTPRVFDALQEYGRVYITGGADPKVKAHVAPGLVEDDVVVAVEAGGKRFSVNGKDFRAKSEEQEAAVPDRVTECAEKPMTHVDADNE